MDIATVKQRQQAAWAAGDYSAVGTRLLPVAELLCDAVHLRAGERVLDVACGNGNATLAAARRFALATGIDYVPALLERARQRARADASTPPSRRPTPRTCPSPTTASTWCCPPAGPCSPPTTTRPPPSC